eukprot:Rmarinus@m.6918
MGKIHKSNPHRKLNFILIAVFCVFLYFVQNTVFMWPVIWALLSVSVAQLVHFGALTPKVFGKHSTGHHSIFPQIVFLPYFLILWVILKRTAKKSEGTIDQYNEVSPKLYLGRRPETMLDIPANTKLVVDLTAEIGASPEFIGNPDVLYRCLPVADFCLPENPDAFWKLAAECAYDLCRPGAGNVYIHCYMGRGRSALLVVAVLLCSGRSDSIQDAINMVQRARPSVHLIPAMQKFLHSTLPSNPVVSTKAFYPPKS